MKRAPVPSGQGESLEAKKASMADARAASDCSVVHIVLSSSHGIRAVTLQGGYYAGLRVVALDNADMVNSAIAFPVEL